MRRVGCAPESPTPTPACARRSAAHHFRPSRLGQTRLTCAHLPALRRPRQYVLNSAGTRIHRGKSVRCGGVPLAGEDYGAGCDGEDLGQVVGDFPGGHAPCAQAEHHKPTRNGHLTAGRWIRADMEGLVVKMAGRCCPGVRGQGGGSRCGPWESAGRVSVSLCDAWSRLICAGWLPQGRVFGWSVSAGLRTSVTSDSLTG